MCQSLGSSDKFRGTERCNVHENMSGTISVSENLTVFEVIAYVDTASELARVRMGGILQEALIEMKNTSKSLKYGQASY